MTAVCVLFLAKVKTVPVAIVIYTWHYVLLILRIRSKMPKTKVRPERTLLMIKYTTILANAEKQKQSEKTKKVNEREALVALLPGV